MREYKKRTILWIALREYFVQNSPYHASTRVINQPIAEYVLGNPNQSNRGNAEGEALLIGKITPVAHQMAKF